MDLTSKYFPLLNPAGSYRIRLKHLLSFLLDIHRVGKFRELVSFLLWEVSHRLHIYHFTDQYVRFTDDGYLSVLDDEVFSGEHSITSSFLAKEGLCFQPVAVDWRYCSQTTDGRLWGVRYSRPNALCRSDDQSGSAVLIHEFAHSITSLFISQQNVLFVCANGVIYKSNDQGGSFVNALALSTPISYFLFNNGMTELPDGTLLVGEYGSIWRGNTWQNLAFLY